MRFILYKAISVLFLQSLFKLSKTSTKAFTSKNEALINDFALELGETTNLLRNV